MQVDSRFVYRGDSRRAISFPLGGIGSGSIGLAGTGHLIDWEIFNRPNKGGTNGLSHFGIKVEDDAAMRDARTLHADTLSNLTGELGRGHYDSFGFGVTRSYMTGVPHFRDSIFTGTFPCATIDFFDDHFPGRVSLEAFNPFIPLDEDNSSLPAGFFTIQVTNTTSETLSYTVEGSVSSPAIEGEWDNRFVHEDGSAALTTTATAYNAASPRAGGLAVATLSDGGTVSYQENWYRGAWFEDLGVFWKDFTTFGALPARRYGTRNDTRTANTGTVAVRHTLQPGETRRFRFVIAWYFPNCYNYWSADRQDPPHRDPVNGGWRALRTDVVADGWKNYYATQYGGALDVARYALAAFDDLERRTRAFAETLYGSSLPPAVIDAVGANLSTLKTATCLRLEDGSFYGFEGTFIESGCCEGSCTHVWNYAYALPYLFPRLERSMRDLDFRYNQRPDGGMSFRLQLPVGTTQQQFRPCVDGQMGGVIKTYRDWKISGDSAWLRRVWPAVKRSLEFAWSLENEDRWDATCSGVIDGRQHHTLDMELFGPNSWLQGFYLAALKAGAAMAEDVGDHDSARLYRKLFDHGRAWMEEHLFNGSYYFQQVDLNDRSVLDQYHTGKGSLFGDDIYTAYWDAEHGELGYQIADGCSIDQVVAQWHANLVGLGRIFDPERTQTALKTIFATNHKYGFRRHCNPCRIFALNDDAGTVICEWPEGTHKPAVPVPYSEETMHGFEYQVGCHMIQEGLVEEGLTVVAAVRERYRGHNRNPWNEIECGSNYARSMASYALLPTFSGFEVDLPQQRLRFAPLVNGCASSFLWSCDHAWGRFSESTAETQLAILEGELMLLHLELPARRDRTVQSLWIGDRPVVWNHASGVISFSVEQRLIVDTPLRVMWEPITDDTPDA